VSNPCNPVSNRLSRVVANGSGHGSRPLADDGSTMVDQQPRGLTVARRRPDRGSLRHVRHRGAHGRGLASPTHPRRVLPQGRARRPSLPSGLTGRGAR
jgi:hypothetical protein